MGNVRIFIALIVVGVVIAIMLKTYKALENVTPADVYYGRDHEVLERRKQIKQKTLLLRRKQKRSLRLAAIAGKVYVRLSF